MAKKAAPADKTRRAAAPARKEPGFTVIGGVRIKLAKPAVPSKNAVAIRKAVKDYYAARRG